MNEAVILLTVFLIRVDGETTSAMDRALFGSRIRRRNSKESTQVIGLMISTVNTCSRKFGGVVALLDTIGMVRRKDNQRET